MTTITHFWFDVDPKAFEKLKSIEHTVTYTSSDPIKLASFAGNVKFEKAMAHKRAINVFGPRKGRWK